MTPCCGSIAAKSTPGARLVLRRDLARAAARRPAGYVELVESLAIEGTATADSFEISAADWHRLRRKFKRQERAAKARRLVAGAKGLASATLGLDRASREEVNHRLAICATCPELTPAGRCRVCSCWVSQKARLSKQSCPKKLWSPV